LELLIYIKLLSVGLLDDIAKEDSESFLQNLELLNYKYKKKLP